LLDDEGIGGSKSISMRGKIESRWSLPGSSESWIQGVNSIRNFLPSTDAALERVVKVRLVSVASSRRLSAARLVYIVFVALHIPKPVCAKKNGVHCRMYFSIKKRGFKPVNCHE